uniref:FAD dependent oxidoreductase domain-containing protein n=1 Tax=Chlamydomonas euryale TaxID=1486919 RepID=A0A6U2DYG8_9CHLO|mmetsp:Transcript_21414/g.64256  ORF Transcript_21414/g.64256 Transcript_21414/m.64256 type:complete len:221 (+) Transcript_21414:1190-1852(+)
MLRRTSLAYHLSRLDPDVTVALVDGRHIAGGATGRNGGLLWPCLNASFKKMLATKGVASSSEIMRFEEQASTAAADFIEQTPGMRELVEFAWLKEGGLYLFESEEEAYDELQELKAMTDRGWSTDLEVWGAAETNKRLGSVGYHGAIRCACRLCMLSFACLAAQGSFHLHNSTTSLVQVSQSGESMGCALGTWGGTSGCKGGSQRCLRRRRALRIPAGYF